MPELDPLTTLASAVHAAPGAYALLAGSGLSRGAEIPTGYQVMCALIERVAAAERLTIDGEPEAWYRARYGEPSYDALIERLAPGTADRHALLRPFFEPTVEDQEHGRKLPTTAHRAIARLVARGSVRVILTTNFDPLLELALEAEGVRPQVLASESQAASAIPVAQVPATILKVNGDYRDAGMRNTRAELAAYGPAMTRCIERAFADYGLVVCGWSATYDEGLRKLLHTAPSTPYSTFWTALEGHEPEPASAGLIAARGAQAITIDTADRFFEEIEQRVQSLARVAPPSPLTPKLAADRVKRYLRDGHAIDLEDLVLGEVERLRATYAAQPAILAVSGGSALGERLAAYEADVAALVAMLVTGCWWAPEKGELWARAIADLGRFFEHASPPGGTYGANALERYPAVLALYGAALAAFAHQEWALLYRLWLGTEVRVERYSNPEPPLSAFHVYAPFKSFRDDRFNAAIWPEAPEDFYRENLRLRAALRPAFAPVHLTDRFERTFLEFEGFLALVFAWMSTTWPAGRWFPVARAVAKHAMRQQIRDGAEAAGTSWEPLQAGFFNGSLDEVRATLDCLDQQVTRYLAGDLHARLDATQPLTD